MGTEEIKNSLIEKADEVINQIGFEPTASGSVFTPTRGWAAFHKSLNEYFEMKNKALTSSPEYQKGWEDGITYARNHDNEN